MSSDGNDKHLIFYMIYSKFWIVANGVDLRLAEVILALVVLP